MIDATGLRRSLAGTGSAPDLGTLRREASLDALSDMIRRARDGLPQPHGRDPMDRIVDDARAGFAALGTGAARLDPGQHAAMKAIILSDGSRPAVLVQDGAVDPAEPALGTWRPMVEARAAGLSRIATGVGRVGRSGPDGLRALGTAFAIGDDSVATNRHVLQAIARPVDGGWVFDADVVIDFGAEHDRPADPARRFAPLSVRFAGPSAIGETVDPALLDLAVIALAPNGLAPVPDALPFASEAGGMRNRFERPSGALPANLARDALPGTDPQDVTLLKCQSGVDRPSSQAPPPQDKPDKAMHRNGMEPASLSEAPDDLADEDLDAPDPAPSLDGTDGQVRLAAMGYPVAPADGTVADRVLFRLFRGIFGVKRLSPGLLSQPLGTVAGDRVPPRCFGHDASTLGGSSGSCLIRLDTCEVIGLHIGGRPQVDNLAHAVAVVRAALEIQDLPVA